MRDTDQNIDVSGLAAIINSRLATNARVSRAIGFGWICGGLAIASVLASLGIAIAFLGYSHMISVRPAAEQTAKAVADAIKQARLKTEIKGTVSLAAGSELRLAPNQTVKIAEGTILKIDPNSSVRVVGDIKIPQPSPHQLQRDTMSGDQLPFTSYTIFRSVDFGPARVETGWNFDLSDTTRPKTQYCSYIQEAGKGARIKDLIAVNGLPRRSAVSHASFDFDKAVANCIWFSGI